MPKRPTLLPTFFALALAALPVWADDPWSALETLRRNLASGPELEASFEQQFQPAGFDAADIEKGQLALDLPFCLRWDYSDPFPKSYLLCGSQLYLWNPGEAAGELFQLDDQHQPGLDLLLAPIDELRERYDAELAATDEGLEIRLEPLEQAPIQSARLRFDPDAPRVFELVYRDPEGNQTRFLFQDFGPLERAIRFDPPEGVVWEEN